MKVIIVFVASLLVASAAFAQSPIPVSGFVEGALAASDLQSEVHVALTHPLKKKGLAIETWILKTDGYGEAYTGISVQVTSWAQLTWQAGLEQYSKNPLRVAGTAYLAGNKMSLLAIIEGGGSGAWHKVVAVREVSPRMKFGVMSQTGVGAGFYAEAKITKNILFYEMLPLINLKNPQVGVRMIF